VVRRSGQPVGTIFSVQTLKMGQVGCPEKLVRNYHYSLCSDPEERSSHLLHGGSLKSWIFYFTCTKQMASDVILFISS